MADTLIEAFDQAFQKVKIDARLGRSLYQYQVWFVNKNHEHMEFFGSNLLGVHTVRFTDKDVAKFYDEVLDIDFLKLVQEVRTVPTINHTFKVSADVLNLTLMYLIHRFINEKSLAVKVKERAMYDTALIFFYRCVAAITSDWIKYSMDPKIAQAAYANLNKKFLLKRLGSWHKVMDYRARDLIDPKAIHYKRLSQFTDDSDTVYIVNDSQGRIRDLIKNYYSEFMGVHGEGNNIAITSSTFLDAEGEETIKEKTKSVERYVQYMRTAISDQRSFVKDELVSIITKINSNTSFRIVKHTLNWMVENAADVKNTKLVDEFMSKVLVHSMYLISSNIEQRYANDYAYVLTQLKNLYLSTRSSDRDLLEIRELGEQIITKANGKVSASLAMSTRTSLILYLTLRALVGARYNS